jgi:hypothetical protein
MLVLAINSGKSKIRTVILTLAFALAARRAWKSQGAVDGVGNPLKAAALAFQVKTEDRAGWHFGQFSDSTWNFRLHDRPQNLNDPPDPPIGSDQAFALLPERYLHPWQEKTKKACP